MTDFLLELRSEEIPARMQDDARQNLKRLFEAELAKVGLKADAIATYATPRRLALIAYGLPLETHAVSEERKGPRADAPEQAIAGFKRNLPDGVKIVSREDAKGTKVLFAIIEKPGLPTDAVLMSAIHEIIRNFPWPKSMRWGEASVSMDGLRWVRPLQGIVALLGERPIICGYDGIESSQNTVGHRFHAAGPVFIQSPEHYADALRAAHVIVDQEERRAIIREGAEKCAGDAGLMLVADDGLVNENAGLTEWPVPMLGRFDPAFLSVPEEVIQLTARVNQKYFICRDSAGTLDNAFVCTANIEAVDGGAAIVAGNEKVLAARLSDAKFFWEQDLKVKLDVHAEKLNDIVFHEKLGTVADKVERVAKLARWLVESGVIKPSPLQGRGLGEGAVTNGARVDTPLSPEGEREKLADQAERAARLCKADLVTGMVGEFPELQGIMGGYYARPREGHAIADAVRDHYKPVGQGDDVPTAPVTVAVSLADKLDTIVGFFAIDEKPTGSKDPFALRRAAIGILSIVEKNGLRIGLSEVLMRHCSYLFWSEYGRLQRGDVAARVARLPKDASLKAGALARRMFWPEKYGTVSETPEAFAEMVETTIKQINDLISFQRKTQLDGFGARVLLATEPTLDFIIDRLKVQQRESGVRHDLIDAVFALGVEDDLVRLLARVRALQAFVGTDEGANLLSGYKRAANILKQNPSPLVGEGGAERRVRGSTEGGSMPPKAISTAAPESLSAADAAGPSPALRAPSPTRGEELKVETTLQSALDVAEPLAIAAIEAEDFEAAMSALASLRAPIDAFFAGVMVNDPDAQKRAYRLGLLARFRDAVHRVADFSKIEG